jgi:hypothetical protein
MAALEAERFLEVEGEMEEVPELENGTANGAVEVKQPEPALALA